MWYSHGAPIRSIMRNFLDVERRRHVTRYLPHVFEFVRQPQICVKGKKNSHDNFNRLNFLPNTGDLRKSQNAKKCVRVLQDNSRIVTRHNWWAKLVNVWQGFFNVDLTLSPLNMTIIFKFVLSADYIIGIKNQSNVRLNMKIIKCLLSN